jgi:general nucleoside transport system permease protein
VSAGRGAQSAERTGSAAGPPAPRPPHHAPRASRPALRALRSAAPRALAACVALVLVGGLSAAVGASPGQAIEALLTGAFGSPSAWTHTLLRAVPILLTGLAVAWAFRAGLFNIGAEGQLLWGAVAAGWAGAAWSLPALLHVPVALGAGALAGALWAWPAAFLKSRRGTPEVVTTLLLNFVAVHLTTFLANHPLHDPSEQGSRTARILSSARLLDLFGTQIHLGLPLALGAACLLGLILTRARGGFQLRIVGHSPEAARSAGLSVEQVWSRTLLTSGALAGLAGAVEVLGVHHYFEADFSPGYGYEGIAVAILGGNSPVGVVLAALFWGGLANGAVDMEATAGVSRDLVRVIQAFVVLTVAIRRWPSMPRKRKMEPQMNADERG